MIFRFEGEVIEWRGPAPFLFVRMPEDMAAELREMSSQLSYGWGCIPAQVVLGKTAYRTSLFPKDGSFLVPVKVAIQRSESVGLGDHVSLTLEF